MTAVPVLLIENQVAMGEPAVTRATLECLLDAAVGRMTAILVMSDVISESVNAVVSQEQAFDEDADEAQAVMLARMALMNWISQCIDADQPAIPDDCWPGPEPLDIFEAENNFSSWCRGVTAGHGWLEDVWDEVLVEDSEDDRTVEMALYVFAFFTNRIIAERFVEESAKDPDSRSLSLEETAAQLHPLIADAVVEYAAVGLANRQIPSAPPPTQPVRSEKIGRNQPCPCGSGKKYKKCCGGPGASRLH